MQKYSIKYIPGTLDCVMDEIKLKFPQAIIISNQSKIIIKSDITDIFLFSSLLSPLSITNDQLFELHLFKKSWRTKTIPASINSSLAFIMCQIAQVNSTDTIYDPFCGCGTIPITASKYFFAKKTFGSDLSGKAIDYCQINSQNAILNPKQILFFRSNISMVKLKPNSIDKIITNLPFGIRVGTHIQNIKTYQIFCHKAFSLLKTSGTGVILTQEKNLFTEIFSSKFHIQSTTTIDQGGLMPTIFMIKKNSQ
jgi:23S rRNA G2445 N2-methylase RlmL